MVFFLLLILSVYCYNPSGAVDYVNKYWNNPNHDCSQAYTSCSEYSYFGSEHCGYPSHGGDCANFVSQSLIAGGHPLLNTGGSCRGYPCGKEEVGAKNLGDCLSGTHYWKRTCAYHQGPPAGIATGDVLIFHKGSCTDYAAHATIITEGGSSPKISCHSPDTHNANWDTFMSSHPYLEWLQYPNGDREE